ncbi:MAG TPA: dihydropteroate synthase-like protein [Methanothrix sp.]|nr:dihydropteroate synthase-like protein [Methanothrix sp.]
MKVLAVTGRLAEDLVRSFAKEADVLVLNVDVASFITPRMLLEASPGGYDLILIPGAVTADFGEAEKVLETKVRLGPKHAADLGFVLRHLEEVELSRTTPACVLLDDRLRKDSLDQIECLEAGAAFSMQLNGIKIGGESRMKVLGEIVDATRMSPTALTERIHYYEEQGADMIDLGLPLDAEPSRVSEAVRTAKDATILPVSIDTVRPDLIHEGLEAGADLVLSLNAENLPVAGEAVASAGVPAVIIPGPGPVSLEENIERAKQMGIAVIADPVLAPPLQGLASSLRGYHSVKERYPDIPLFFGIGNVTELLDADSQGVNALLAALGAELGASVLFTPEYSAKTKGSVRELRLASKMMLLAQRRRTPPKDLGIDLLVLKEKRQRPEETMPEQFVKARSGHKYEPDPAGSFRISISDGRILARDESTSVAGKSAKDILNTLIEMGLVTRLDHAGYLGRELEKAEIALGLGRSYSQDEPLWSSRKS